MGFNIKSVLVLSCLMSFILASAANGNLAVDLKVPDSIEPKIFDNSTKSVVVKEGENAQLHCYARGHPAPEVSWFHENHKLIPTGRYQSDSKSTFIISNVTKKDRGTYICVAKYGIGQVKNRSMALFVKSPPMVSVQRQQLKQALFHDMDLDCDVDAYPAPTITWWNEEMQLITNNEHYSISNFSSAYEIYQSKLRIVKAEKKHFGKYQCKAINEFGSDQSYVQLKEVKDPVCPPACDINPHAASAAFTLGINHIIILASFLLTSLHVWRNGCY